MRILFVMRHSGYVRNFESTIRMLCERGNRVHLGFQRRVRVTQLDPTDIASQLSQTYPNFSHSQIPMREDGWGLVSREARLGLDYLRYLRPEYRDAPKLRERARKEAPADVLASVESGAGRTALGRRGLVAWLRAVERSIPRAPEIDDFIKKQRPDVLAVTPLIEPGAPQVEYVRSARAQGVRTALCVASWDNLTNKGLIHGPVDLVTVWNDAMKREAVTLHGVPKERVVVTGAAAFDHWFDWRPSTTRDAFCARVGLPADRPYLLYLCSSRFVTPLEVPFVRRWVERIRQAPSSALRDVGVLVRPHPQNADQWRDVDLASLGVAVWPRAGEAPVDDGSRSGYFDSIYHSVAVVGINTTAEIESAIVGRRAYTVLADEFRDTQEGTLHFHHLKERERGVLRVARDFDEHLTHLDTAIRDPDAERAECARFVESFVRPYGLDSPATPRLVEALEALSRRPASPSDTASVWAPLLLPRLARRKELLESAARAEASARAARDAEKASRQAEKPAPQGGKAVQQRWRRVGEDSGAPIPPLAPKVLPSKAERTAELARRRAERMARDLELRARVAQKVGTDAAVVSDVLAVEFCRLQPEKRRSFLTSVLDFIPHSSFVELHAATPRQKLDYPHADIFLRATTKNERFRLRACSKEPFTIDWIHRHIGPGDVLYDIGANVGVYSLVAAKKPGGGARAYAFEPSYASVASLCANIVLNDLARQVTPLPLALSDTTGMAVFHLRDLEPGAARHVLDGGDMAAEDTVVYAQPVITYRLDDAIAQFKLPPPNHIKLDVDGGELAVLHGAAHALSSPALRSMLVEVSVSLSEVVAGALEAHGLRLHEKIGVTGKSGEQSVWYGLFTRTPI